MADGIQQPLWRIKVQARVPRAWALFVQDIPKLVFRTLIAASVASISGAYMSGTLDSFLTSPQAITLGAAALGVSALLLWDLGSAWVKALTEEARDGNWRERTYTFHDKIVFSVTVRPTDNDIPIAFKVRGVPWGSTVYLSTQVIGRDEVWCRIQMMPGEFPVPWIPGGWGETFGFLQRHRTFWLVTHMPKPANFASVHVKLLRWTADMPWHRRKLDKAMRKIKTD